MRVIAAQRAEIDELISTIARISAHIQNPQTLVRLAQRNRWTLDGLGGIVAAIVLHTSDTSPQIHNCATNSRISRSQAYK